MSFLSDVSKTWLTQLGNSLAVQPYMCLVCSVIQFLLDDRIWVFFAVMLLWMHLASLALLPRPGIDSLTQNFLKQSTMMSVGGTLTIDWRSELLASVSLVFFFASIRLMGISSVPITTLDMVASAMESSTMTGGATSSTSSSGSLGDGVLTVLLLFFEGAVALRPYLVQGAVFFPFEASMMAKVQNKRLELLEWSVESLMDDEEMRSGSSIGSVLISIFYADCSGLLIGSLRKLTRGAGTTKSLANAVCSGKGDREQRQAKAITTKTPFVGVSSMAFWCSQLSSFVK